MSLELTKKRQLWDTVEYTVINYVKSRISNSFIFRQHGPSPKKKTNRDHGQLFEDPTCTGGHSE